MRELSLHILDIAQNSIESGARNIEILIDEDESSDVLTIVIADDGKGIPPEILKSITDPFVTTRKTRRVGLGIPLFQEAARMAGGDLEVRSTVGEGTEVIAEFKLSSIDRAPLGDMAETMALLMVLNPDVNFRYEHTRGYAKFVCSTDALVEMLGDTPIWSPSAVPVIRSIIREGLRNVQAS
ncbi:MAG TPA: ATP-binding protein [Bacillota bacterium]|nr:ATP-binding protein [Bacillota bacterium]NLD13376.1 ATP-binding protein [Bacillota bacterium]HAV21366.1 ATP-binding protein [Bacillota bacterium]HOB88297.1 ATP-binding protein [Bacillota bacterium]HOJ57365.1 ATP-binding protein [Bacillota bacterium]